MKRAIFLFVIIGFFLNISDAISATCYTFKRYHGTFCQEDENNETNELLHHDGWGITNKYTYQKYVYCPVETLTQQSVPPVGNWDLTPYTIYNVTACARDYNYVNDEDWANLWLRVCYASYSNGISGCGSWYQLTSSLGDECVDLSLPATNLQSNNFVYIEAWIPPRYFGYYSYVRGYDVAAQTYCQ